ncbi:MAG: hypothetical protein U1A72_02610 [Sulfuritalea sp.]|nr:hypothetical protein [Sulfuritalea sp.]
MTNDERVVVDAETPAFLKALRKLDTNELKKVLKTFRKLETLTWVSVFQDHGLKWEQVKGQPGTYTIRLSQSYRAVVEREGSCMVFQAVFLDHDGAYGKK